MTTLTKTTQMPPRINLPRQQRRMNYSYRYRKTNVCYFVAKVVAAEESSAIPKVALSLIKKVPVSRSGSSIFLSLEEM